MLLDKAVRQLNDVAHYITYNFIDTVIIYKFAQKHWKRLFGKKKLEYYLVL